MMQMRHYKIYKFYDCIFCGAESNVVSIWTEDLMTMTTKKMMPWASRGLFQDVFCVGKFSHWEGEMAFSQPRVYNILGFLTFSPHDTRLCRTKGMIMKVFLSWLSSNICITIKPHPLRLFLIDQSFQDQCYGKPWLLIAAYDGWLFWHLTNQTPIQLYSRSLSVKTFNNATLCYGWFAFSLIHLIMTEWLTEWLWHPLSTKWFDLTQPAEKKTEKWWKLGWFAKKSTKFSVEIYNCTEGSLTFLSAIFYVSFI